MGTTTFNLITGDMFDISSYQNVLGESIQLIPDAICITTNGFVKKDGTAVMGRGCAYTFAQLYPDAQEVLGYRILLYGNIVQEICRRPGKAAVYIFPVKPESVIYDGTNAVSHMKKRFKIGDTVPGWAATADIDLIIKSANRMVEWANDENYKAIVLPRPGCGAGELSWPEVSAVLSEILDDRFYCITFK